MRRSIVVLLLTGLLVALTHGSWGARREMGSVTGSPARSSGSVPQVEKAPAAPRPSSGTSTDHDARSIAVLTLLLLGGPESARPLLSRE